MRRRTLEIGAEPRGRTYHDVFYRALPWCAELVLVVVPLSGGGDPLLPEGRGVLSELSPYLRSASYASEWPGTRLDGGAAGHVHRYHLTPPVLDVVTSATDRLFGWRSPGLPQDIALMRSDGSPFLVTVTHQEWAALELDADEEDALGDLDLGLRSLWGGTPG